VRGDTERAPEHFAIDFVQLDAQGRLSVGAFKTLHTWPF
jgi:murein DD-endopeptidase MepM/ murein hydrolase activator NlpD